MGQKRAEPQERSTIGDRPDDVWPLRQTMLDAHDPATPQGPRRVDLRRVLHGRRCRVRTGGPWPQVPTRWGDDRTVHRHCQPWCQRGLLARRWAVRVEAGAEGGLTGHGKPPTRPWAKPGGAATGWAATPRTGATRGATEAPGGSGGRATGRHPSAGANVHDTKRRAGTLEAIVVERPPPTEARPQHLCLDKGSDHPTGYETVATQQYTPPSRRIGEETLDGYGQKTSPARRWVVERTWAWLSTGRGRLVRSEPKAVHV